MYFNVMENTELINGETWETVHLDLFLEHSTVQTKNCQLQNVRSVLVFAVTVSGSRIR